MLNRLKGILYNFILWFAQFPWHSIKPNRLLIVKTDEIGDYILWRNFIPELINSKRFHNYEIHFCGNRSIKNLYENFDKQDSISKTYWLDKIKFKKNISYRYEFLRSIFKGGYSVVINPIYSRDKRYDDSIVRAAKSPLNIGMEQNLENLKSYEKGYDKNLYQEIFRHSEKPIFEFYRNKLFTSFITGLPSKISTISFPKQLLPELKFELPKNYIVIFPGSRNKYRTWPIENFIKVADWIFENYGLTAVVCGSPSDASFTKEFCSFYSNPYIDLTGKTTLSQMLTVLNNATCLISVDTGSVHLAASVGCAVIGIFNGSQYKRFAPYPKEIASNFYAVYPDEIENDLNNFDVVKNKYEFVINQPYSKISSEKIITIYKENIKIKTNHVV